MKKIIILLFSIFPLFASCQNKEQTINYNGVSVQIPSDWGNKNTENHYEETDITEYQISCWAKDKTINTLAIQWIDTEVENDLYIETMIEMQQERFPMYKQLQFSEIVDTDFQNMQGKKCHFGKSFGYDDGFEGEYFSFTKNGYSYLVMISGDKKFYKSADYNKILNSIKPSFSGVVQSEEKKVQTSEISDNFTHYEFKEYSLSVPNSMELRGENSFMSLVKEITNDKIENIKKIDINDFNFVFQPLGCDDVMNIENQKKALALFARILISYQKGEKGDFMNWNDNILLTQSEYNELNKAFKSDLLSQSEQMKQVNIKLLNIENIKISKNSNKFVYIMQSYSRNGLNGDVKVTDYYLFNNSEMVKLTVSFRISESNLWEKDFEKILDTFSFNSKK